MACLAEEFHRELPHPQRQLHQLRGLIRLAEIVVNIPALRERTGDIALLAHALTRRLANEQNRGTMTLATVSHRPRKWMGTWREPMTRRK